jgi:hypothetical protein
MYTDRKDELEVDLEKDMDFAVVFKHSSIAHYSQMVATVGCMNPNPIDFEPDVDDENECA